MDTTEAEKQAVLFQNFTTVICSGNVDSVKAFVKEFHPRQEEYRKLPAYCRRSVLSSHPVCVAAKYGHVEIMDYLISLGFNPMGIDHHGSWRPIHYATYERKLDVLKSLVLKHKVSVDSPDVCYDTPLFLAIDKGYLEVVKFLVESGASLDYREPCLDKTPLHKAAIRNHDVCSYLISMGASINAVTTTRLTPLHEAASVGNIEVAELLLDSGADVNFKSAKSVTPFMAGVFSGNVKLLKLLHSRGGDASIVDEENNTPLHVSISRHLYDVIRYLILDIDVALDQEDANKDTPFSTAVKLGNKRAAQLLIKAGYDPQREACIYDDKSLESLLESEDGKDFVKYLRQIASNPRSLQDVCCFRIRRLLGRDVPSDVDSLHVPQKFKDFIMLRHCHL